MKSYRIRYELKICEGDTPSRFNTYRQGSTPAAAWFKAWKDIQAIRLLTQASCRILFIIDPDTGRFVG